MRITQVDTFPVAIPLATPVRMSHVTIERSRNVLVRITTDTGLVGWGEGVEAMDLTGENQGRIRAGIDHLGEFLVGRDPLRRTELWMDMRRRAHGNHTSIGAIDIALHDLAGHAHGLPVSELIGGTIRSRVPALTLIGSGDPDADVEAYRTRHRSGYRWFKLKLGISDPATEAETVRAITSELAGNEMLGGDANGIWDEHTALRFLRSIEGLGMRFVEQPTLDRDTLVRVAASSPVPICADESAHSHADILAFGPTPVAGVSLKLIKLGGITGVMRGATMCEALGLHINLAGKVAESSVAAAANVHCAAAIDTIGYGCSPGNQNVASDVAANPVTVIDGSIEVPKGPGLGIDVDPDLVESLAD